MQLILITSCVFVLISWVAAKRSRRAGDASAPNTSLLHHIRAELRAWLITAGALIAVILLLFIYTSLFGPIRPIHEWGT